MGTCRPPASLRAKFLIAQPSNPPAAALDYRFAQICHLIEGDIRSSRFFHISFYGRSLFYVIRDHQWPYLNLFCIIRRGVNLFFLKFTRHFCRC